MKGYVDVAAADVRAGDVIVEPWSGVLSRVEGAEPAHNAHVVLALRGLVSRSLVYLSLPEKKTVRRAPRA